jgi:hypothetical protein
MDVLDKVMSRVWDKVDTEAQKLTRHLPEYKQREVYEYLRDEIEIRIEAMASSKPNASREA